MSGKYDLNIRLVKFGSDCIDAAEKLPRSFAGIHIGSQLIRSATSPALHYGEAQAAESTNDFIHKMKVCLKELRETFNCLLLIQIRNWLDKTTISSQANENNELIAIFVASIKTAQKNREQGMNR
jgi:four helix bundle protein